MKINIPVIVEGRYDKAKLRGVIEGTVIATDGFGVFANEEKRALIKRLGERGIVILSDSDGGGRIIRSHLRGMLGGIKVYDLYIPRVKGKEKRKSSPSKEGYLGVEGMDNSVLHEIFAELRRAHPELFEETCGMTVAPAAPVTLAELYELGLTGGGDSQSRRDEVCVKLRLPSGMNAKGFREAVNLLGLSVEDITL